MLTSAVTFRRALAFAAAAFLMTPALASPPIKLTAGDAAAGDEFGITTAVSGDTIIVGAPSDDDGGADSGAAYVFVRNGSSWTQQAKLTANDAGAGDVFGGSVAISGDTVIIGADGDDDGGADAGAAYIFVRTGSSWSQQAKLTASDAAASDSFGISVAISGDTAVVGASRDDDGGSNSGAAYAFVRSGASWSQQAKLTAGDAATDDQFGDAVALSGDSAIVGSRRNDNTAAPDAGSAYVFVRTGTSWSQQAKLFADDAASFDNFGRSVAISGDNAIVGAPIKNSAVGSAYVFVRSGSSWSQQMKLTADDAQADDRFGRSVAISGDNAIIGASNEDDGGEDSGAAYLFVRTGSSWTQQPKIVADDAQAGDGAGRSVAMDASVAIVGVPFDDDDGGDSGAAYVVALPCLGDTNGDNIVDFTDLNNILFNFGNTGVGLLGDLNCDDVVSFTDLNQLLFAFGSDCLD